MRWADWSEVFWRLLIMSVDICVGDHVRLLGLPDWLIHDLPESEQLEMRAFVGRQAVVTSIDVAGYFWIGFGEITESSDIAYYSGHSFCVPRECLSKVSSPVS
jgi:hypothetical protein